MSIKNEIAETFVDSHKKENNIDFKNDFGKTTSYLLDTAKEVSGVARKLGKTGAYSSERFINIKDELSYLIEFQKGNKQFRTSNDYVKNMAVSIDIVNNLMHACVERKKEINKYIGEILEKKEFNEAYLGRYEKKYDLEIEKAQENIIELNKTMNMLGVKKIYFIQRLANDFNKDKELETSGAIIGLDHEKKKTNNKNTEIFAIDLAGVGQVSWHISKDNEEVLRKDFGVKDYKYDTFINEKISVKGLLLSKINDNDLTEHQKVVKNSKPHNLKKNLNNLYLDKNER